jgi:hypothetical protein
MPQPLQGMVRENKEVAIKAKATVPNRQIPSLVSFAETSASIPANVYYKSRIMRNLGRLVGEQPNEAALAT